MPTVRQEEAPPGEEVEYTIEDYVIFAAAIADGLNWEDQYNQSIDCVYTFANLGIRLEMAVDQISNITTENGRNPLLFGDVIKKDEFLEMALALGNVSTSYKSCWNNAESSISQGVDWAAQFPSFQTYIIYLLPNLLAQAVVLNRYIERIRAYEEGGNQTGVYYIYAVVFRKIYLYDMPEFEDIDDDYYDYQNQTDREAERVQSSLMHLMTPKINFKFS